MNRLAGKLAIGMSVTTAVASNNSPKQRNKQTDR